MGKLTARSSEEREAKLLLVDMERIERGEFVRGYGSDKQRESQAARAKRKADRAARQKRLEAESRARIEAKGGQGQRPVLNAKAHVMVQQAEAEGRELTFEEAKRILRTEEKAKRRAFFQRIGVIAPDAPHEEA